MRWQYLMITWRALASVTLVIACGATVAAPNLQRFDLPEASAVQTLRDFSVQSHLQILFSADAVHSLTTREVRGEFDPERALNVMLGGTGLKYSFINSRTVAVVPVTSRFAAGGGVAYVADAGERPAHPKDEAAKDSEKDPTQDVGSEKKQTENRLPIPEVLVHGSRSTNADIRRTSDDIQPYVVIDRSKIERSSASSVEGFLKSELPMNTASADLQQASSSPGELAQGKINLRGLGTNQTLVLVDGRRLPGVVGLGTGFMQADISGIPLSSIERIEILPATASAIYGGAATGGVINIIRKRDFSGIDIGARYGNAFAGDAGEVNYYLNGGFTAAEGKTSVTATAAYSKSNPLLVAERTFGARSRAALFENDPSVVASSLQPPDSTRPNICSALVLTPQLGICGGSELTFRDGTPVTASITAVPRDYDGPSGDAGKAFLTNAGRYNLDIPRNGEYLLRSPVKNSVALSLRQAITPWLDLQISGSRNRYVSDFSAGVSSVSVVVSPDSNNNPFQQSVLVNVPLPGFARRAHSTSDLAEGTGSFIVRLPGEWSASLDRTWGRSRNSYRSKQGALISEDGLTLLSGSDELFRDGTASFPDLSSYETGEYDVFAGPYIQVSDDTALRVSGPAMRLPAGPLTLSALAEHRRERTKDAIYDDRSGGDLFTYALLSPKRWQSVNSLYLEGRAPLVGVANAIPLVKSLELQASVRRDSYEVTSTSDFLTAASPAGPFDEPKYFTNKASSTDYLIGFKYAPSQSVSLRSSYGTGFLPADLNQIAPSTTTASFPTSTDPKRGGTTVETPYTFISGGNPGIKPELSRSWSIGAIFNPSFLESARLSLDYTRIKKSSEITPVGEQFILDNEALYPSRVTRGPNLPGDLPGWSGPVTEIDTSVINILSTSVKALDLQFTYNWQTERWGTLDFSTVASRMIQFERRLTVASPSLDSVGYLDGPLRWKATASLSWQRGPWSTTWATQFFDGYLVFPSNADASAVEQFTTIQGGSSVRNQIYHDLYLTYRTRAGQHWLMGGVEVSFGVQNVFNANPPLLVTRSASFFSTNTYSTYGDPRLRRYSISLQKSFGK